MLELFIRPSQEFNICFGNENREEKDGRWEDMSKKERKRRGDAQRRSYGLGIPPVWTFKRREELNFTQDIHGVWGGVWPAMTYGMPPAAKSLPDICAVCLGQCVAGHDCSIGRHASITLSRPRKPSSCFPWAEQVILFTLPSHWDKSDLLNAH